MRDILDVIKNVESIYSANTSLSVLKDFERVLDEMDMYVYKNWEDGELAEGPFMERHWIKASFMWPKDQMPDPMAAKRLLDYGCRAGTKKGKLDRKPIWIVEITMPRKLVADTFEGYMTKMRENMGIGSKEGIQAAPAEAADNMQAAPAMAEPAAGAAPGGAPSVPTV